MGIRYSEIIIISALFNLIGCSNLHWPPHESTKSSKPFNYKSVVSAPTIKRSHGIPAGGIIRVKKGETVFILSRRFGVPIQKIVNANDLHPPYRLRPGTSLIIPKPRLYVTKSGDSLYKISRQFGANVYELARLNRLKPPFRIYVGQQLILPSSDLPELTVEHSTPTDFGVSSLRKKYLKSNSKVQSPKEKEVTLNKYLSNIKKNKSNTSNRQGIKIPKIKTSGRFNWPVRGRLSSIYGSKGKGLYNDGINIVAPKGASVRAAGKGVIAYAGNELRGFGNLLLIKHSGGWVTAYAHNEKLLVKRGDKVSRGQVIAKVGASGNVVLPQLHFEVRKGKRAINPLRHLKQISAVLANALIVIS